MKARLDHVVFWVEDPLRSVEFYERVVGLKGVRVDEFKAGKAPFPSVRISEESIIDLMAQVAAPLLNGFTKTEGSAGNKVNHLCLSMGEEDFHALRARLDKNEITVPYEMEESFGARGSAPKAFYFIDPDGNILEARYYDAP